MSMQAGQCLFFFFLSLGDRRGTAGGIVLGVKILLQSIWIEGERGEVEQSWLEISLVFSQLYSTPPYSSSSLPPLSKQAIKVSQRFDFFELQTKFSFMLECHRNSTYIVQNLPLHNIVSFHLQKSQYWISLFCTFDLQQYHEFLSISIQIES